MPPPAPEELTDEREISLWNWLTRDFSKYLGYNEEKQFWIERTESFQKVLRILDREIEESKNKRMVA